MAFGKQVQVSSEKPVPLEVPPVAVDELTEGLAIYKGALAGVPDAEGNTDDWLDAYRTAQAVLQPKYGKWEGDAILWRAHFLDSLVNSIDFCVDHVEDLEFPTPRMIEVAATIQTFGCDREFDRPLFEKMLYKPSPRTPWQAHSSA